MTPVLPATCSVTGVCFGGELRIAQQHARILAFVVEDHVEHAVVVEVDQADGLRVEDALSRPIASVASSKVPSPLLRKKRLGPRRQPTTRSRWPSLSTSPQAAQVARPLNDCQTRFRRHVGEMALAVVVEQLAAVGLRHEQVGLAVVVEVAEDRADLARAVDDAGVLRLDEALAACSARACRCRRRRGNRAGRRR